LIGALLAAAACHLPRSSRGALLVTPRAGLDGATVADVYRFVWKDGREWILGGPRLRRLALSFVNTSDWKVFTKRAKVVLDARPNDGDVARFLIGVRRYPGSWIGSMEPYLLRQAEAYRQWTRSRDARLRALGAAAVAEYERLANEAVAQERRERESY
jgi:hypothetical protein